MKKIFVTGATGFIGANLVRALIKKKYEVHIIKRKNSDLWRIKNILNNLRIYEIDLLEKRRLAKLLKELKPNIIFHLANLGLYHGIDAPFNKSFKINLLGTINLIEAADSINYECFINTGSSSEYGNKTTPMREDHLCEPASNYALTKLATTLYAKSYAAKTHKPLATLRLFSPFGSFDHPARFITETILKLLKGEEIYIKDPTAVRDYIYIEDVVSAYLQCIKNSKNLSSEIINIGSGKQINIQDMLRLLTKEIPPKNRITYNNSTCIQKRIWQANIDKAQQKLNWHPKANLSQGLIKTMRWFKANKNLYDS